MKIAIASLLSGFVFGAGLFLSGMTEPRKVMGFLDFTGRWDPSLAFVMAGALAVHVVAARLARARKAPVLDAVFHVPNRTLIDGRLLVGSALFGVGWALSGMCPGPAITSLASAAREPFLFVVMMALGALVGRKVEERVSQKGVGAEAPPAAPSLEDA